MEREAGAKEKLLDTAIGMLCAGQDMSTVTTRALAARAGVNTALINYYFGGKEGLFSQAVDHCMAEIFDSIVNSDETAHPVNRIRAMAKAVSDVAFSNPAVATLALRRDTQHGDTQTLELLLPALRMLYGARRPEAALRRLSAQLVLPMQCMLLSPGEYERYLGVRLADKAQRDALIDDLIDDLLRGPYAPEYERDA